MDDFAAFARASSTGSEQPAFNVIREGSVVSRSYQHVVLSLIVAAGIAGWAQAQPPSDTPSPSDKPVSSAAAIFPREETNNPYASRSEREARLKAERAAFFRQQRALLEEYYRFGSSPLRPWRPSNPYMQSRYPSQRTIYVPMVVIRPESDPRSW